MTSDKKYYVYIHRKATDGAVFYVGKGSGSRAWNKTHRSEYWKRVFDKHGLKVEIVYSFVNEICALSFERALIKFYGRENLCNLSDGGLGVSGITENTRHMKSNRFSGSGNPMYIDTVFKFYHKDHGLMEMTKHNLEVAYGLKSTYVSKLINGKSKSIFGWTMYENRKIILGKCGPNRKTQMTIETYKNIDGREWVGNFNEFCLEFLLNKTNVYKMRTGRKTPYRGWSLAC